MLHRLLILAILGFALFPLAQSQEQKVSSSGHYLFAWTGDIERKANDFLAVIDADPASPDYGYLITTVVTDQKTGYVHHTEYTMPASGMLFANDHDAGRTFIFDVRDPLHPKTVTSFTDMDGYMHPHSFLRLPNGDVLASFQHSHHGLRSGFQGESGGLVEIDDTGKVIRSASNADPAFPDALLTPYSLAVLPDIDRVVSTNSSMHDDDIFRGVTYQIWRLSDLKLLHTEYFDVGENRYAQISPEEARRGPDGSVFVQTLGCGLERITGIDSDHPRSQLVYTFPGNWCGVPTIVGHYLIQPAPNVHTVIVVNIANAAKPTEVSRIKLPDDYRPHWTGWDAKTNRVVITPGPSGNTRLFLLKFDPQTGELTMDDAFHDADGKPGFSFANRDWPHGWKGTGAPHGAVFSR
jgi:56kDa selenium binding protein (SBP56)